MAKLNKCRVVMAEKAEFQILGLPLEVFLNAVRHGEIARDNEHEDAPPMMAGVNAWGGAVLWLRYSARKYGWTKCDKHNVSSLVSPDKKCRIIVRGGTLATGNPDATPRTTKQIGNFIFPMFERQMEMFEDTNHSDDILETYILLINRSENIVRSELSLPVGIHEKRVNEWGIRHVFPDQDIEQIDVDNGINTDKSEDVHIPLKLKTEYT